MKKLICLLLCLCLLTGFGSALAAPGRNSSGEPREERTGESSREPSGEAPASEEAEETASEEPGEASAETELDLSFNGVRVADMGVDVSTDGRGTYRFSLKTLLGLLGLEMSMDEADGSLVIRDKFGILGALLD